MSDEKLIKNFISYEDILDHLKDNKYSGLLLKFGGERCPPCRALDRGPLEEVNVYVNRELSKRQEKMLLVINCDVNHPNITPLMAEISIPSFRSIPAFFLFKYLNNKLILKNESMGYDMAEPKIWFNSFTKIILNSLI